MVFTDAKVPNNPIIFANDSFLSLSGYDREEVLGKHLNFLLARGADPEALAQLEAEFEGCSDMGSENHYRRRMAASSGPPPSLARSGEERAAGRTTVLQRVGRASD